MTNRNYYWIAAGLINLFTAFLHTIGGQLDLINPMLSSQLSGQIKTELAGAWHIVTIVLFVTSYHLLRHGLQAKVAANPDLLRLIGLLYILFSAAFIGVSLSQGILAPQWIILLPIGILCLLGIKRQKHNINSRVLSSKLL
ncbi:MAG: hypothetical protein AAF990_03510 [Bacteroidota bacterium]